MGTMVVRGECHGTVEKTGINTELGTTALLLNTDEESSNLQKLLIKIVSVLVVLSVTMCGIVLIYLCTKGGQTFTEALSFAVVVLVASIPMVRAFAFPALCFASLMTRSG
jgi:magnesium-transporting ATPase (P-type)